MQIQVQRPSTSEGRQKEPPQDHTGTAGENAEGTKVSAEGQLTHQRLISLLSYDPSNGSFTWRVSSGRQAAGTIAGRPHNKGYWTVTIGGFHFYAHRLAWFYVWGKWPSGVIDHRNRKRSDNRISNLRDVTQSQNLQNQQEPKSNNKSGYLGVSFFKIKKPWVAEIQVAGKRMRLGYFSTAEEASAAYQKAKSEFHIQNHEH